MKYMSLAALMISILLNSSAIYAPRHRQPKPNYSKYLIEATINNDLRTIAALLRLRNTNVNKPDAQGNTALHYATTDKIVNALLARGANVNIRNNSGQTPLHIDFSESRARALLNAGADLRTVDNLGRTPLHYARSRSLIRLYVICGADVNAQDNYGHTPLFHMDNSALIRALAESGTLRPDIIDNNGQTALFYARSVDVLRALHALGLRVEAEDIDGNMPVHRAANAKVLKELIKLKANINHCNKLGQTPYQALAQKFDSNKEQLLVLLQNYALTASHPRNVSAMAEQFNNLLDNKFLAACFAGDLEYIINTLESLDQTSQENLLNSQHLGMSPIMAAISQGHERVVVRLLHYNARVTQRCINLAIRNGFNNIADIIRNTLLRNQDSQEAVRSHPEVAQERPATSALRLVALAAGALGILS